MRGMKKRMEGEKKTGDGVMGQDKAEKEQHGEGRRRRRREE